MTRDAAPALSVPSRPPTTQTPANAPPATTRGPARAGSLLILAVYAPLAAELIVLIRLMVWVIGPAVRAFRVWSTPREPFEPLAADDHRTVATLVRSAWGRSLVTGITVFALSQADLLFLHSIGAIA